MTNDEIEHVQVELMLQQAIGELERTRDKLQRALRYCRYVNVQKNKGT